MERDKWILALILILAMIVLFGQMLPKVTEKLEKASKIGGQSFVARRM